MKSKAPLDYLFRPHSIAILGASANPASKGYDYLKGFLEFDFPGQVYPVNPKVDEIFGLKAYSHITDIPGEVEYVISCINARSLIDMMADFSSKGVKAIQLYSSGFSETGEPDGIALEQELTKRAGDKGIRVLGPNCMGIHYPNGKMAFGRARFSKKDGQVGSLVQSGGHGWHLLCSGSIRGIGFSKIISFGNASDINETDLLEYLAQDRETKIITAYIEGIKDGNRFSNVARTAAQQKPLIVIKGGRTDAGKRTVASHTGSLAGSNRMWDAFFHQAGIIRAYNLDELIDFLLPFVFFPKIPKGSVGVVGGGGGASVQAADDLEYHGLKVPSLPVEIREGLKGFTPLAGSILGNPVDTVEMRNPDSFIRTFKLVASWEGVDLMLAHLVVEIAAQWQGQSILEGIVNGLLVCKDTIGKPIAVVLQSYGTPKGTAILNNIQKRLANYDIPVYFTTERAAKAIGTFVKYHKNLLVI
ncbi:MAG: CoA-binding protein [Thermodesulfobacteriota bacterium]|nr:CoA-binding protein [Thermodesulfobacteriota bacterium]